MVIYPESLETLEDLRRFYREKPESYWQETGARRALEVFKETVDSVPAYQGFLRKHNINPETIGSISDFASLPSTTKKNYFDIHPLQELALNKDLTQNYLICTSSGSSGKPHYWPRLKDQDTYDPATIELAYSFLGVENHSTLVISCLAMGTWVAGNMMIDGSIEIAKKPDRKMTVITPGAYPQQILSIVQDIGHHYDQIILIGYPPTIRRVIIEGLELGINWKDYAPKLVVGAEPISQDWKDFMLDKIGSTNLQDIMVIFGMAEMHIVAFETPIVSLIRKALSSNPDACKRLFGDTNLAALMQYDPTERWIEEENGELVITARCGIPFIKYRSHDLGGTRTFSQLSAQLQQEGINLHELASTAGLALEEIWQWPFFYCFGRGDSISIMGANIYPANLERFFYNYDNLNQINDYKIGVAYDDVKRPRLQVYIEQREGIPASSVHDEAFIKTAEKEILALLLQNNADYADAYQEEPLSMTPQVQLISYQEGPFALRQMKQNHIAK